MRIGLLTNSFVWAGMKDLGQIADWAVENGFEDLEVGPSIGLDEDVFKSIIDGGRIAVSALIYCRNFLSGDRLEAEGHRTALKERIEFASRYCDRFPQWKQP